MSNNGNGNLAQSAIATLTSHTRFEVSSTEMVVDEDPGNGRNGGRGGLDLSSPPVAAHTVTAPSIHRMAARHLVEALEPDRLARAKEGFSTRRVPKSAMKTLVTGRLRFRAGDLVLARVERILQHSRIELPSGRRSNLQLGWELILACGNRYASDQFEGLVPEKIGRAHLIAAGGVVAVEVARARGIKHATEIEILGAIGDKRGLPLNLMQFALPQPIVHKPRPPIVAVFGSSMNSGKTTTARLLVSGLISGGFKVGYAKLTGTGAGGDYWSLVDAGAVVVDFTDAGLASTYKTPVSALENISLKLIGHLANQGCDCIVVEIADGLLQQETAALMQSHIIHTLVDNVIFAAGDPLAAQGGVMMLRQAGFNVVGVAGLLTASPLPTREAKELMDVPVWLREDLLDTATAVSIATRVDRVAEQVLP
ncbi:MAG: DUF1611 domain-containing protein [Thermoleophilia bacterium]|jgi:hypothetical protein